MERVHCCPTHLNPFQPSLSPGTNRGSRTDPRLTVIRVLEGKVPYCLTAVDTPESTVDPNTTAAQTDRESKVEVVTVEVWWSGSSKTFPGAGGARLDDDTDWANQKDRRRLERRKGSTTGSSGFVSFMSGQEYGVRGSKLAPWGSGATWTPLGRGGRVPGQTGLPESKGRPFTSLTQKTYPVVVHPWDTPALVPGQDPTAQSSTVRRGTSLVHRHGPEPSSELHRRGGTRRRRRASGVLVSDSGETGYFRPSRSCDPRSSHRDDYPGRAEVPSSL